MDFISIVPKIKKKANNIFQSSPVRNRVGRVFDFVDNHWLRIDSSHERTGS
jgi:hypothetical protein